MESGAHRGIQLSCPRTIDPQKKTHPIQALKTKTTVMDGISNTQKFNLIGQGLDSSRVG